MSMRSLRNYADGSYCETAEWHEGGDDVVVVRGADDGFDVEISASAWQTADGTVRHSSWRAALDDFGHTSCKD